MNSRPQTRSRAAFTLVELLVIIVILAVLATMVLPALAGTRTNTKAAQCMNNLRRLTSAWQMHINDNADSFPLKIVANSMDWFSSNDNTNSSRLIDPTQSEIARYVQSADLFKCPADNYQSGANLGPRVLSISGNALLGNGIPAANVLNEIPNRTYIARFTKFTQLNKPGPANTITMLDEHPDSIDDALFIFSVGRSTPNALWRNVPASHHNGAASISFADGHMILKRWLDSRTAIPVIYASQVNFAVPGSPDYTWMNDRMPYQ